jgi:hypothetical protein
MADEQPKLTKHATLDDRIGRIERLETELVQKAADLAQKKADISHADMFVIGALRRTLAQSKGFRELLTAKNFSCAAAFLRMHIDTAMRVNALLLVEDRGAFCEAILGGTRFNTLKDSEGRKLTDAYLRKKLAEREPWINELYEQASDFVHLSGRHFYGSIFSTDDDTRTVRLVISGTDPPRPDSFYFEIVDAFFAASKVIAMLLLGYFAARARLFENGEGHPQKL